MSSIQIILAFVLWISATLPCSVCYAESGHLDNVQFEQDSYQGSNSEAWDSYLNLVMNAMQNLDLRMKQIDEQNSADKTVLAEIFERILLRLSELSTVLDSLQERLISSDMSEGKITSVSQEILEKSTLRLARREDQIIIRLSAAGAPTAIQFPETIRMGFQSAEHHVLIDRYENNMIVASKDLPPEGQAALVLLTNKSIIALRFMPEDNQHPADTVISLTTP